MLIEKHSAHTWMQKRVRPGSGGKATPPHKSIVHTQAHSISPSSSVNRRILNSFEYMRSPTRTVVMPKSVHASADMVGPASWFGGRTAGSGMFTIVVQCLWVTNTQQRNNERRLIAALYGLCN